MSIFFKGFAVWIFFLWRNRQTCITVLVWSDVRKQINPDGSFQKAIFLQPQRFPFPNPTLVTGETEQWPRFWVSMFESGKASLESFEAHDPNTILTTRTVGRMNMTGKQANKPRNDLTSSSPQEFLPVYVWQWTFKPLEGGMRVLVRLGHILGVLPSDCKDFLWGSRPVGPFQLSLYGSRVCKDDN